MVPELRLAVPNTAPLKPSTIKRSRELKKQEFEKQGIKKQWPLWSNPTR
jgi:hypothetical protein